jgi:hypothetical protein
MQWVEEWSEPVRKRLLMDKRLRRLQAAVKADEPWMHKAKAAENVRLAALSLIKAMRALVKEYPRKDPDGRLSLKLQEEEQRWLSLSTEAIVEEYGKGKT